MSHAISDRKWKKNYLEFFREKYANCVDRTENTLGLCKKSSDDKAFSMYRTTVKRKAIQSFSGIFCYAFLHLTIKAC